MIELTLILLSGLGLTAALKRQSAATRHWTLTLAILCAAASPALERVVPAWSLFGTAPRLGSLPVVGALPSAADLSRANGTARAAVPAAASGLELRAWLIAAWAGGAFVSLAVLAVGLARLRWLRRRSREVAAGPWAEETERMRSALRIRRPVRLVMSRHPALLVTWGVWRPTVLLPDGARAWPRDRMRVVLAHELAHVRRADWLAQLAAEVVRGVCWFNPVAWAASRRLRRESEQACDDVVIGQGVEPGEYASHLLELARAASRHRHVPLPAPAMARPGSLERRISAMLNARLNHAPADRSLRTGLGALLVALAALVTALGAEQTFSTFSGSVLDPSNRPTPSTTVTLTNVQTEARYEVRSGEDGRFEVAGVPPGEYTLEARLPGFKALKGRVVIGAANVQKDIALEIGSLTETIHVSGSRSTPSTVQTPPQTAAVVRKARPCEAATTGGNVVPPLKLRNVNPVYPAHLQAAGVAGTVLLEATIGVDGQVADITVLGQPDPALAQAAMDAVRQWEFTSTLLNCDAIPVKMNVTITFTVKP
jgi:TonB family protein